MPQSLQCPRCDGAVSVPDHAAGKRVKCPHCEQAFLAPGVAATANDDDDWLKLDDDPVAPAPVKPVPVKPVPVKPVPVKPVPVKPGPVQPVAAKPTAVDKPTSRANAGTPKKASSFTADEEALLAEFTSDLDEFTAEIETPPAPHPSTATGVGSAGGGAASAGQKPKPAPQADVVEYASNYRVTCNVCGSMLYAKASQAGQTVKCSDCYSAVTIPPPPRVRKKQDVNLDEAGTFAFKPSEKAERRADPYQKSAEQLLDEASRVEEKSTVDKYDDTPSVKEWIKNVFGVFTDLGVVAHWIGLSVLGSVPAVIALTVDVPILIMGLFPAGFFLAVLTVSCGFAILNAAANQEESVSEWPTLDPMAWFGQLFVVLAAASVAAIPVWAACQLILGTQLISVAITMFSIYAMFPFVLLSMLDMNSPFVPFSAEVARSVTKCEEAWGGFYFSSGLVFVSLFMIFATAASTMGPPVAAVVSIVAGVGVTFIYFSMLGRLAYAIGQAVNAPPMENDIDRTRHSEAEEK